MKIFEPIKTHFCFLKITIVLLYTKVSMAYAFLLSDTGSITPYSIEQWLSAITSQHIN